jgi:hypothetical protein
MVVSETPYRSAKILPGSDEAWVSSRTSGSSRRWRADASAWHPPDLLQQKYATKNPEAVVYTI